MKLGLIGKPLSHSWSPQIHEFLIHEKYGLWPLEENELAEFFRKRNFDGINVTIPYKEKVIQYLDEIDDTAAEMGAVNCITNRNGILKGYNTDCIGLKRMLLKHEIDPAEGTVAILGSGGASKAAVQVCRQLNWEYVTVSRSEKDNCITYDELEKMQERVTVLINATPVGMYPDEDEMPTDINIFGNLRHVVDIVANPLRTALMYEAKLKGINALGGLEMLVSQALSADELFAGEKLDDGLADECVRKLLKERRNIILIGMPSSGKSTIGRKLAEEMQKEYVDMDKLVEERIGMTIAEYFALKGEEAFRDVESEICRELRNRNNIVVSTGGGVIKRKKNMFNLAYNGYILWIDRYVGKLIPTESRPLSRNRTDIYNLYQERKELYRMYSDAKIKNDKAFTQGFRKAVRLLEE